MKIAVFVSGRGSNLQSLIDAQNSGKIKSKISLVISNKADAYALTRANKAGIENAVSEDKKLLELLKSRRIDLVVLAGYLKKIPTDVVEYYKGSIINIHPSLLPKFGGKGYYGMNVHNAVFKEARAHESCKNGEYYSGATVHFVNNKYDDGDILMQARVCVSDCKSPEEIATRVLNKEHEIIVDSVILLENRVF